MAKSTDQLAQLVAPVLTAGESLIATARVNYNGTVPPNNISMNSNVGGLDHPDAAGVDPDTSLAFPTASQMALALTDGRIFIWSLGMTGKPKQFVGEVPLSGIAHIEAGGQTRGESLRIHMKSSAIVDLKFMRGDSTEEFEKQLSEMVNDGAATVTFEKPTVTADSPGDDADDDPADDPADDDD